MTNIQTFLPKLVYTRSLVVNKLILKSACYKKFVYTQKYVCYERMCIYIIQLFDSIKSQCSNLESQCMSRKFVYTVRNDVALRRSLSFPPRAYKI